MRDTFTTEEGEVMLKDTICITVAIAIMISLFAIWALAIDRCEQKGGAYVGGTCIKAETINIFGENK